MLLTTEQRLAASLGLDIDAPLGRGSTRNRQWPGGVMAYVIDSSLSMFLKKKYHDICTTSLETWVIILITM